MQAQQKTIAALRQQLQSHSRTGSQSAQEVFPSGLAALNQLLPGGGFRAGDLWEWIAADSLAGPAMASLLAARNWLAYDRPAILLQRSPKVFSPALAAAGFDLQSLTEVHASNDRDLLWAWEQALGCSAVSLVWGEMPRIAPLAYRRLKLAAESSGAIGFLIRPKAALKRPTWANGRLLVTPVSSTCESPRFIIEMNPEEGGRKVEVEFGEQTVASPAAKLRQRPVRSD